MTEQQTPDPLVGYPVASAPAAATTPDTLSSPVPAPDANTPAPEVAPPPAPEVAPPPAAPADQLQAGDVKTLTTEDSDGFVTETPCLVLDTFEHDDAAGESATFAHVVVLPPASVIKTARLS